MNTLQLTPEVKTQQDGLKQNIIALLERDDVFVNSADFGDQGDDTSTLTLAYNQYDEVTLAE
jgi:hypothetical protein